MPIVPDEGQSLQPLTAVHVFALGGVATLTTHGQTYGPGKTVKQDIAYGFTDPNDGERYTAYLSIRVYHEPPQEGE